MFFGANIQRSVSLNRYNIQNRYKISLRLMHFSVSHKIWNGFYARESSSSEFWFAGGGGDGVVVIVIFWHMSIRTVFNI